jgi:hypothetical protein
VSGKGAQVFLQLSDRRFLFLNLAVLLLAPRVFFKELIEQHCVDLLVTNRFRLALLIASHQSGSHFGNLFSDQAKRDRLCRVILLVITKTNRLEPIDCLAGFMHRLDVVFIPARRYVSAAESAAAVYGNQVRIRPHLWLDVRIDLADIATVADVLATDVRANADYAVGRRDATPGLPAHSRVEDAADVVKQGAATGGSIEVAGGVIGKRVSTMAAFTSPVVLLESAPSPMAVLKLPVALF